MVDRSYDHETGRGQLMERLTLVQNGDLSLDAIYLRGPQEPCLVVAPGRGTSASSMEGPIANELCYAAAYRGHASLRFAWRGHSASEGTRVEIGAEIGPLVSDLDAAITHLSETVGHERVAVASLMDGAEIALAQARRDKRIELVAMIDPPESIDLQGLECRCIAFFPGQEPLPKRFAAGIEGLMVRPVKNADKAFRQGLGTLGMHFAALLPLNRGTL